MISIFDNITAVMIAGVVLLILFAIQQRSTDFNIEQNAIYSSKKFSIDFSEWIEKDLGLVGDNMDHGDVLFEQLLYENVNTKKFVFNRDSIDYSTSTILQIQTSYDLDSAGVLTLPDTTIQLYNLKRTERIENGAGGWHPWHDTGIGPEWISHFRIDLADNRGRRVLATEDSTAFLNVAFTLAIPNLSTRSYINEYNWSTTINIRRY